MLIDAYMRMWTVVLYEWKHENIELIPLNIIRIIMA